MKAIILAGGSGTRLQPLTYTTQKQLLPVGNKPVIEWLVRYIESAGIKDIGVIVGGDFPEKMKNYLQSGERFGVEITYIEQGEPRGLADAVSCAEEYVGKSPFLVCFGDTLIDQRIIKTMIEEFQPSHYSGHIPMQQVENPSRFGIAEFDGDHLEGLREKPSDPPSDLAYMGALVFTPVLFDIIEQITPSERGELELTDAIDLLVKDKPVQWESYDGTWIDVGTPEDLIRANAHMLRQGEKKIAGEIQGELEGDGPVQMGSGSVIQEGATVVAPVSIGENVVVTEGATVGPLTSISDGSTVAKATVKNSVLLGDVTVRCDGRIEESILGNNSSVRSVSTGDSCSVILGDDSSVTFRGSQA